MINKKGFTLTELLIVIVIIGILGAIALPRFAPKKEKARVAEAIGILSAIRMGEAAYALENNNTFIAHTSASVWDKIGVGLPAGGFFSYTMDGATGQATATRLDGDYQNKTITLSQDGTWGGTHPMRPADD